MATFPLVVMVGQHPVQDSVVKYFSVHSKVDKRDLYGNLSGVHSTGFGALT